MQVRLNASGGSGNPGKVMYYLGMSFVIIGAVIGVAAIVIGISVGSLEIIGFVAVFVAMFCGIGGLFAKLGHDALHTGDEVLERGATYMGKINAHEPDYTVTMNGMPCITLVVRYLAMGQIREARVATGESDVTLFPRGATVSIKIDNGLAALVPGSVSNMPLEQEDDLMNPDFDPGNTASSVGVSCPNCGANIAVPLGMSRFCPYCNTKISVDENGRLVA